MLPEIKAMPEQKLQPLDDLYGIFIEDINHTLDGGLYAELVQNRSFEFDPADHANYTPMTAWKIDGDSTGITVQSKSPLNKHNQHYLAIRHAHAFRLINTGYNSGMPIKDGETYHLSFFARNLGEPLVVTSGLDEVSGEALSNSSTIVVDSPTWKQYTIAVNAVRGSSTGQLWMRFPDDSTLDLDMVSLFPKNTFHQRPNGARKDLAEYLEAMHPKFVRFPGGCLIHDGTLDDQDRESMYRWKTTLGPIEQRPTRRNKWGYNQTLGFGFYELFQFCEDLRAKPLPVVPGGYDPHHQRIVPMAEMQPWIDDALDLIEFANGDSDTKWGQVRTQLGHPEPFKLEYIGVGNEEVGQPFFDRYPLFQEAINVKYPEIKVIGTSGPFASGSEFKRGWDSAKQCHADLVDEHYYMTPHWFLANHHRYDDYGDQPGVFLGEYASKGNTWYNAVVEASYMLGLERNAGKVKLACYAPLLANQDYINWKPDLIYFDQNNVSPSVNYDVQKLFTVYQGTTNVAYTADHVSQPLEAESTPLNGDFGFEGEHTTVAFKDLTLTVDGNVVKSQLTGEFKDKEVLSIGDTKAQSYQIDFDFIKTGGREKRGFSFYFGRHDNQKGLLWLLGGWENQDSMIREFQEGTSTDWNQAAFTMKQNHQYHARLVVTNRHITTYLDGIQMNDIELLPTIVSPFYSNLVYDRPKDAYYLKLVNVVRSQQTLVVPDIAGYQRQVIQYSGKADEIRPEKLQITKIELDNSKLVLPKYSVSVVIYTRVNMKGSDRD